MSRSSIPRALRREVQHRDASLLPPLRGFLVGEVACHLGLTPQALRDRPFGAG